MISISGSPKLRTVLPWVTTGVVSTLAVCSWGQEMGWSLSALNTYSFFPLLGLVGYSVMWSQYVTSTLKKSFYKDTRLDRFFTQNRDIAVTAIALHPALLVYAQFRNGHGLPPGSYESFVVASNAWVTLLGTASLVIFLTFSLYRWCGQKSWWKYVTRAGDAAMVAMFYHGLRLGSQLQSGWYHYVWIFYGISLAGILLRKYVLLPQPSLAGLQNSEQPTHK